jgi:hypothetical protein
MVYSQTKRTSSVSSITNQAQGGGNKKAGFPYLVGRDSAASIGFHGIPQKLSILQMPLTTSVSQSRPIGVTPSAGRYYKSV